MTLELVNTHKGQDPWVIFEDGVQVDGYTSVHGYPQGTANRRFAESRLSYIEESGKLKLDGRYSCLRCRKHLRDAWEVCSTCSDVCTVCGSETYEGLCPECDSETISEQMRSEQEAERAVESFFEEGPAYARGRDYDEEM